MKSISPFAFGLLVLVSPASAQDSKSAGTTIDITKMSCKALMAGNDADRDAGMSYFHGFLAGRKNRLVIDVRALAEQTDRVADFCLSNPTSSVMDAFAKTAK